MKGTRNMIKLHPKPTVFATAVILAFGVATFGCPPPVEPVDPKPPPEKVADCATACAHLRGEDGSGLDCALGKPSKRGNTCEADCEKLEANGVQFVACTIEAKSCDDAEHCAD